MLANLCYPDLKCYYSYITLVDFGKLELLPQILKLF